MEVLLIFLIVIVVGISLVLKDEYRRQTRGLNLDEQFEKTMSELNRDIRMNMSYGTAVNKGGYTYFE